MSSAQILKINNVDVNPSLTRRQASIARASMNKGCCTTSSVFNSLAAGYVAGISGIVVGHPFESIKVWLQTKTENQNKYLKLSNSPSSGPSTGKSLPSSKPSVAVTTTGSGQALPASARKTALANNTAAKNMSTIAQQQQQPRWGGLLSGRSHVSGGYQDLMYTTRNKLRALYSGVTGPFLTVGVIQCVTFALYDSARRVLHDRDTRHDNRARDSNDYILNDSLKNVAIAGSSAGVIVSLFTGPMITVKVRQQVTGNGYRQAMYETFFREGRITSPRTLFRGFGPHLILETAGRSTYYTTYEGLKRSIMRRRMSNQDDSPAALITIHERMICAALAGITTWTIYFPFDAVRSRLYAQEANLQKKNNIKTCLQMIRSMYYEKSPSGSLRAFYRGFGVTVVRAGPVAAAVLPVYDLSLKWLSSS